MRGGDGGRARLGCAGQGGAVSLEGTAGAARVCSRAGRVQRLVAGEGAGVVNVARAGVQRRGNVQVGTGAECALAKGLAAGQRRHGVLVLIEDAARCG